MLVAIFGLALISLSNAYIVGVYRSPDIQMQPYAANEVLRFEPIRESAQVFYDKLVKENEDPTTPQMRIFRNSIIMHLLRPFVRSQMQPMLLSQVQVQVPQLPQLPAVPQLPQLPQLPAVQQLPQLPLLPQRVQVPLYGEELTGY